MNMNENLYAFYLKYFSKSFQVLNMKGIIRLSGLLYTSGYLMKT